MQNVIQEHSKIEDLRKAEFLMNYQEGGLIMKLIFVKSWFKINYQLRS